jgi:hypothetical protein
MTQNQRKRTRIVGCFNATVSVGDRKISVTTQNLSLKGALCVPEGGDPGWAPGEECQMRISLAEAIELVVRGRVVRADDKTVAIDFTGMDENSYAHLRNIIRFSAEDPDAIDAEQLARPFA